MIATVESLASCSRSRLTVTIVALKELEPPSQAGLGLDRESRQITPFTVDPHRAINYDFEHPACQCHGECPAGGGPSAAESLAGWQAGPVPERGRGAPKTPAGRAAR